MSESDVIKVTIDDSELDAALAKIQQIVVLSEEATATAGATGGAKGLPGINRELRLILGQLPGMREAIQVYFRASRVVRATHMNDINIALTLLATTIIVYKQIMNVLEENERRQREYDQEIIKERRLNKEQFVALKNEWKESARSMPG